MKLRSYVSGTNSAPVRLVLHSTCFRSFVKIHLHLHFPLIFMSVCISVMMRGLFAKCTQNWAHCWHTYIAILAADHQDVESRLLHQIFLIKSLLVYWWWKISCNCFRGKERNRVKSCLNHRIDDWKSKIRLFSPAWTVFAPLLLLSPLWGCISLKFMWAKSDGITTIFFAVMGELFMRIYRRASLDLSADKFLVVYI